MECKIEQRSNQHRDQEPALHHNNGQVGKRAQIFAIAEVFSHDQSIRRWRHKNGEKHTKEQVASNNKRCGPASRNCTHSSDQQPGDSYTIKNWEQIDNEAIPQREKAEIA